MPGVEYEALPPTYKLWVHLTAGALAGLAEHTATYPIDSVKTREQSLCRCPKAKFATPFHEVASIIRNEGWKRPLRGVNAVAAGSIPAHALYFTVYEKMKDFLTGNTRSHSNTLSYGLAGIVATMFHDMVMNPAEVVKQRMQMVHSPYGGSLQCVACVYKNEGLAAFYRSYPTQLIMNGPFQAVHFMTYEFVQQIMNPEHLYDPKTHLLAGGLAGGLAATVTTPLDCVKTVLNTQQSPELCGTTENAHILLRMQSSYTGVGDAISAIYRARGIRGFTCGIQARVMQSVPAIALSWSVYELFKFILGDNKSFRIL